MLEVCSGETVCCAFAEPIAAQKSGTKTPRETKEKKVHRSRVLPLNRPILFTYDHQKLQTVRVKNIAELAEGA